MIPSASLCVTAWVNNEIMSSKWCVQRRLHHLGSGCRNVRVAASINVGRTIFAAVVNNLDSVSSLTVFTSLSHSEDVFCPDLDKTIFPSPLNLRTYLSCRLFPFQSSVLLQRQPSSHSVSFKTCSSEVLLNITSPGPPASLFTLFIVARVHNTDIKI